MQTDPIGYAAGANLYGYVHGDPVNWTDPLGLRRIFMTDGACLLAGGTPSDDIDEESGYRACYFDSFFYSGGRGGGDGRGGSQSGTVGAQSEEPKYKICSGRALVYAGNPRHVGREGGMLRPIRSGAVAIIPRQWTGTRTAGPMLRREGALVGGVTGGGQRFSGLDDTAGNMHLGPDPQGVLLDRADGALFVELVTGWHEGMTTVTLAIPIDSPLGCPEGTAQTGTR